MFITLLINFHYAILLNNFLNLIHVNQNKKKFKFNFVFLTNKKEHKF
jgi:hypothetical protein